MAASGGTRAIVAAMMANAGIAIAKFVAYLVTGSASMLAESVHSVADTSNQGLLLLGGRQARKIADDEHQFGYGRKDTSGRSSSRWSCSPWAGCTRYLKESTSYAILMRSPRSGGRSVS